MVLYPSIRHGTENQILYRRTGRKQAGSADDAAEYDGSCKKTAVSAAVTGGDYGIFKRFCLGRGNKLLSD